LEDDAHLGTSSTVNANLDETTSYSSTMSTIMATVDSTSPAHHGNFELGEAGEAWGASLPAAPDR
jgi:hypothetical protein